MPCQMLNFLTNDGNRERRDFNALICQDQLHMGMIQKNPPPYQGGARGGYRHTVGNWSSRLPEFNQSNAFGYCGEFGLLEAVRIRLSPSLFAQLISTQPTRAFTFQLSEIQVSLRTIAPNSCSILYHSAVSADASVFKIGCDIFCFCQLLSHIPQNPYLARFHALFFPQFSRFL